MAGLGWQELVIVVVIVGALAVPLFGLVSVIRYRSRTRDQPNTHVSRLACGTRLPASRGWITPNHPLGLQQNVSQEPAPALWMPSACAVRG
jgi:hypothetical protein